MGERIDVEEPDVEEDDRRDVAWWDDERADVAYDERRLEELREERMRGD